MNHEQYIKRCLEISKFGLGTARPNPSVGAVLVVDDKIIGEGFTSPYGGNHAEVNAINSVDDKELLKQATIYVTLEPCSHHGKTPPCADLIIKSGIKNIIIGSIDSNELVSGKGIKRLKKAGCNVLVGVLENKCLEHHKRFFTFHHHKRPFIILKWAETSNGFIAPKTKDKQAPVWITNNVSRQLVHKWRSEEHAILVGSKTVLEDNPSLNVRHWRGENPVIVVIDKELKIPNHLKVYQGAVKTIFINEIKTAIHRNIFFETINFSKPIASQICELLYNHKIQSVIIEGGAITLQTFIDENLWDEARVFNNETRFIDGVSAPFLSSENYKEVRIKKDTLRTYIND